MSIILLTIAIILEVLLTVPSILFAIFRTIFKFRFKEGVKKFNDYILDLAISIDQLGNVTAAPILNLTCIRSDGYQFGNTRETVSLVLAVNLNYGKLTTFGKVLAKFLDLIDKDHLRKAIRSNLKYIKQFKQLDL